MTEISRRNILKAGGLLGASATLARSQPAAADETRYRFFNADEAQFIEAAVDRLIPPDPKWPGAMDAGVPVYIDRQLFGAYGHGERLYLAGPWKEGTPQQGYQLRFTPAVLYRTALRAIHDAMAREGQPFHARPAEAQDAVLKSLEAGERDLDGVPSAVFFETLLANTIEGFFADPAYGGNRDKAGWRMVGFPGAHAAYLGLYTQHGMRFPGEPLAMDETGPHSHR